MRNIEDRCKDQMDDIYNGAFVMRSLKRNGVNEYPATAPRGKSRTALKRKIVTLRQLLMDLYDELVYDELD